ncbi:DUF4269 domain-containing protein [Epilithonimonas lactis]|uniref:DUF4269 domain-containing protein n=1 Tax=Epilithonimonas lactis TaxID=421072 RepID=A0A085BE79_9FLAO|nr:DUF4269 domain-containing protein [Epilithonimonas lactis]KFC20774.1 hypothetical protein IO89_11030 [Epilithonimonas lactis]SEP61284.1 protein of unknown function [Epilithonimonas lactis]
MNFLNLEYLKNGSEVQKRIFQVLENHQIFQKLKTYNPILAGTFPIEINIEGSDLDIILETDDFEILKKLLIIEFQDQEQFSINLIEINDVESLVCKFQLEEFLVELFAQDRPTHLQNAYLHMIKEFEILEREGDEFRRKIIELKEQGFKTEPAFAKLLGLSGDPHVELLKY